MKRAFIISILVLTWNLWPVSGTSQVTGNLLRFDFFGNRIELPLNKSLLIPYAEDLSPASVAAFAVRLEGCEHQALVKALLDFRATYHLDDWLYYQLIRKTAQQISPKQENYHRYTLYKWFLLTSSGYDATLKFANNQLLFYVRCGENIYNIPYYLKDGRQYVCLNYHDYASVDFERNHFEEIRLPLSGANAFSYRVTSLPGFSDADYVEKEIAFQYYQENYRFKVKLNRSVRNIFTNYPSVDYSYYFNIPLSRETYQSLIPALKKNIATMSTKDGVDYLMRFTRYAFLFEPDSRIYGLEKRLTPEQTLLSDYSDCEDRSALFFYLVKEIYNLPMIVLSFPEHVTIAVKFDKPAGKPIMFNGEAYSVCEPTPQRKDLPLGQLPRELKKAEYEVAYVYRPE